MHAINFDDVICMDCDGDIFDGEEVEYSPEDGGWVHVECPE